MNKKVEELKREIIGHKQIIEQLELARDKALMFIDDNYPTINNFEVKDGWHGDGMASYKVTIDVFAEDLHKLVRYFTHNSLRTKKWSLMKSEIKKQIREEVEKE